MDCSPDSSDGSMECAVVCECLADIAGTPVSEAHCVNECEEAYNKRCVD